MRNTTLGYIERDGKYLMLHRVKKENDLNHDKWIGIGGKFEDKESPEECMLRETREETGLTLTHMEYRGIVTFVSDRYETEYMHLFWADRFTGTIPKWEGDDIFLDLLEQRATFFSLKLSYQGDVLTEAILNGLPLRIGGYSNQGQNEAADRAAQQHTENK